MAMDETNTPGRPGDAEREARLDICRKLAEMRKAIALSFGANFSPAPCLDMLVDLYISEGEGRDVYLWSLCMAAGIPVSTAHRKVADLEREGLVTRDEPLGDRRRVGVSMTAKGRRVIDAMLDRFIAIFE
jgi:predicted transcriptional regulator